MAGNAQADAYPHAGETIGTARQLYDGALTPDLAVSTFRNIDRLFPSRVIARGRDVLPLPPAARPLTRVEFACNGRRWDLYDCLAVNRIAGLLVLKDGRIALELYQYGNSERTRWMSMSVAKSITSTLIGAALHEGRIGSLDERVTQYVAPLAGSAYEAVSIREVLTMTSGVRWNEDYTDPDSDRRRLLDAQIAQRPGAALELMAHLPRVAPPGTVNNYSTGETQVAGEVLNGAVGQPLSHYLSERIWQRVGMEADATWWLTSPGGIEIAGSGIGATLRDYGRFGLFFLGGGRAGGARILPAGWTDEAGSARTLKGGARLDYGYFWWPEVPTAATPDTQGAFAAIGICGQRLYINPRERVVIVCLSAWSKPQGMDIVDCTDFCAALVAALR